VTQPDRIASTEIQQFREGAWDTITRRKHTLIKAYVSDSDPHDVMVLGTVMFGHKNGNSITQEYLGNFLLSPTENGPLIRHYQAWLVRQVVGPRKQISEADTTIIILTGFEAAGRSDGQLKLGRTQAHKPEGRQVVRVT
jgi:hypothetical protein